MGISLALRKLAAVAPWVGLRRLLFRWGGVTMGKGAIIGRRVTITGCVTIGAEATILADARLRDQVSIGRGVVVGYGTILGPRATVGEHTILGASATLGHCVLGSHCFVERGVVFAGDGNQMITVGDHCYIGLYAALDSSEAIEIGDYVHIAGPSTGLWTHSSVHQCLAGDPLQSKERVTVAPVRVGSKVWIGGNVTVYPGVTIGHHSVVLPNSVVTRRVDPFTMIGGAPAVLKRRIEMAADEATFPMGRAEEGK